MIERRYITREPRECQDGKRAAAAKSSWKIDKKRKPQQATNL